MKKLKEASDIAFARWRDVRGQMNGKIPEKEQVKRFWDTSPEGMARKEKLFAEYGKDEMMKYIFDMVKKSKEHGVLK